MFHPKRALATAAVAGLAMTALAAAPASAVVAQSSKCTDGGNVLYTATINWNYTYVDHAGTRRASVSDLVFGTAEDTDDAAIDNRIRVYSYHVSDGLLHKIQDSIHYEGEDDNTPAATDVTRNPKNPTDHPGLSRVTLVVGTDGDGLGNCTMTFIEPSGLVLTAP